MTAEAARQESDESLVSSAQAGDTASFGKLVERYKERAVSVAYGVTRNFDDARDAAQDAFVKAYRSLGKFRGGSKFYTWLFRIVTNTALDLVRRRRERPAGDATLFDALAAPAEPAAGGEGESAALTRAIERLSPQQAQVILFAYFHGLSNADTAEILGISEGTVKATRFQALEKLKREMAVQKETVR